MRILIAGGSGFIGKRLESALAKKGNEVFVLTRTPRRSNEIYWNPIEGKLDEDRLPNCEIIINLAGENIASKRWTKSYKERLLQSRLASTQTLIRWVEKRNYTPEFIFQTSAVGLYADQSAMELDEEGQLKTEGFLYELAIDWERLGAQLINLGKGGVVGRIGIVMDRSGGALKEMYLPFKLGLGAMLGNGSQYMSWIGMEDLIRAIVFLIEKKMSGVVNLVAPSPCTNRDFSHALTNRIAIFKFINYISIGVPRLILLILFGEMADHLLESLRVVPSRLLGAKFKFNDSTIKEYFTNNLS